MPFAPSLWAGKPQATEVPSGGGWMGGRTQDMGFGPRRRERLEGSQASRGNILSRGGGRRMRERAGHADTSASVFQPKQNPQQTGTREEGARREAGQPLRVGSPEGVESSTSSGPQGGRGGGSQWLLDSSFKTWQQPQPPRTSGLPTEGSEHSETRRSPGARLRRPRGKTPDV